MEGDRAQFYPRGAAARKSGEAAKAYIYLFKYVMAVISKDGIKAHPQVST